MLKLCLNNPYRPLQNSMKPHSMCSVKVIGNKRNMELAEISMRNLKSGQTEVS